MPLMARARMPDAGGAVKEGLGFSGPQRGGRHQCHSDFALWPEVPRAAGWITRTTLLKSHGKEWFEHPFLPGFHPVMIGALLLTLVLFAFQPENLTTRWIAVLLIAVPIIIQVYFNSGLAYFLMRLLPDNINCPRAVAKRAVSDSAALPNRVPRFALVLQGGF